MEDRVSGVPEWDAAPLEDRLATKEMSGITVWVMPWPVVGSGKARRKRCAVVACGEEFQFKSATQRYCPNCFVKMRQAYRDKTAKDYEIKYPTVRGPKGNERG